MKTIINLPFPGFYESWLSREIDHQVESWAEYEADERQAENGIPPEVRLDQSELLDIASDCMDYSTSYLSVARAYVDAFNQVAAEYLGFDPGLTFESMTSPRFYNFETDRLFAYVPIETIHRLFAMSKTDGHEALRSTLRRRHTSYDGFHSYYSNELDDWLVKPLDDWDHNELSSLLIAAIGINVSDDEFGEQLMWTVLDCDGLYHEFEQGMDWDRLHTMIDEARQAKAAEIAADDPAYVPVYRCQHTQDMFADSR